MEEAGQTCGAHVQGLFKSLDMAAVRNFIVIGDENQRAPIRAGIPFKSLIRRLEDHGFVSRLTKVHRTDARELRARQDAILKYNIAKVFKDSDDYSFRLRLDPPAASNRMSQWVMQQYAQIIYSELNEMKKEKNIRCHEIMGICPYNDYCEVANAVVAELFFDGPDYLKVLPELASKSGEKKSYRKKTPPFYAVGMRVVFNKTKKRSAEEMEQIKPTPPLIVHARGQVGIIVSIVDMERPKRDQDPEEFFPATHPLKNSSSPVPKGFLRTFLVRVGTNDVQLNFEDIYQVRRTISPGHFITGDRSQGEEYDHVIACFPWGNNLATNDVFYTICSRPKKSLCIIGSKSHMEKMVLTPPMYRNWKLDDDDAINFNPKPVTLSAAPPQLMIEAPPVVDVALEPTEPDDIPAAQPVDEFGDDVFNAEDIQMMDDIVDKTLHKDKKGRFEVSD
jgi:hypothetical protein